MKILVIRFSSIGDIVLTTPVVRCLKQQIPNAEVHFSTKQGFAALLKDNPYIDKVIPLQGSIAALAKTLKAERYDAVVDLHANLRTRLLRLQMPGIPFHVFDKQNLRKWLLVKKLTQKPCEHVVDRYMKCAEKLGVHYDGAGLDYFTGDAVLPQGLPNHYHAYAIGGTWSTKRLPLVKMAELISKIDMPMVLLGGKEDVETARLLHNQFPDKVISKCGELSLHQSALVVKHARVVLAHDTGLMHIAAAFNKPVVSIWGNTVPAFGMAPFFSETHDNGRDFMAQVEHLSCRPCSKIGHGACPKGHFDCMNKQDVGRIAAKLVE